MRRTKFTPFRENRHPKIMRLRNVFRWILYGLLILLAFIFSTSGDYTNRC